MTQPKIMLVGEAWGEQEVEAGEPFVGPAGKTLNLLLKSVGLKRSDVFLTNVFNLRPSSSSNDLAHLCGPRSEALAGYPALTNGKYVRAEFKPELDRLYREIETIRPTVVIAAGATPAWALLGISGIRKVRGAPSYTAGVAASVVGRVKVLPTYHPSAVQREWSLRPIVLADLEKAIRESAFPEIRRPPRELWLYPTLGDIHEFIQRFIPEDCELSIDIETAAGQITCVGFAPSHDRALVVPFTDATQPDGNYWRTLNEELEAWRLVKMLCETRPSIGQNFLYDMNYLWKVYGIRCLRMKDDTMLMHHALQPEMEKGLGFLGSIYTDEPAWKFMRAKHETLKKED